MNGIVRVFGLLAPVALLALGFWLEHEDILPIDSPESAAIGIAAVGLVSGVLLRRWWAAAYAPGVILGIVAIFTIYDEVAGPDQPASADRTPWIVSLLIVIMFAIVPLTVGALIGVAIGKGIDTQLRRMTN